MKLITTPCEYCGGKMNNFTSSFGLDCENNCEKNKYKEAKKLSKENKIDMYDAVQLINGKNQKVKITPISTFKKYLKFIK